MSGRYISDGSFDVRSLRHDLRGLLTPLATGLECMKTGEQTDGLMLQEEVLKKLKSIVEQLDQAPAHGEQIEKEPG